MAARLAAFALAAFLTGAAPASAASISHFSVTPSTTQAGGHPNLTIALAVGDPAAGIRDVALRLPAGLAADPAAAPYCNRRRLLADICSDRSKVGSLAVTGEAYDFRLTVTRPVYNVRRLGGERLRLAVPVYGSLTRPGIAAELPIAERAHDRGLDVEVRGLPPVIAGVPVRLHAVTVRIKGVTRQRLGRKWRRRPFLTNPSACTPATSVLELTAHDGSTPATASSSFTPTGCR